MNDDTLTSALDRMATALEPPLAADELVNARRSQLRRRRRVATGLTAASVFAIIATGGVVASGLGNADPAPDIVPATSEGPAPADAAEDPVDPVDTVDSELEIRENDSPWHCGQEAMTLAELQEFRNNVIDEAQLSMDLVDDKVRAYLVLSDKSNSAYELEARRLANGEVEIVTARKCAG
jgi:hypothetical protein